MTMYAMSDVRGWGLEHGEGLLYGYCCTCTDLAIARSQLFLPYEADQGSDTKTTTRKHNTRTIYFLLSSFASS
jgi:hypothetical protein